MREKESRRLKICRRLKKIMILTCETRKYNQGRSPSEIVNRKSFYLPDLIPDLVGGPAPLLKAVYAVGEVEIMLFDRV